jgi:hypothetical protein
MLKKKLFLLFVIGAVLLSACALPPQPGGFVPPAQSQPEVSQPAQNPTAENQAVAQNPTSAAESNPALSYPIVDTAQGRCYDNNTEVSCAQTFAGQDAQYAGNAPRYQDNGDPSTGSGQAGTVTDLVTGLMWQQDPGAKMTFNQALAGADGFTLAGYDDWRLPTIKELYSLILFDGTDVSNCQNCSVTPFIDTRYFKFSYGDESAGERVIDSQFASSTKYVSTTMNGDETMFGVNFADGRIKGYGLHIRGQEKTFYVLYVRGNENYGRNGFVDNGETITDNATGLTWMKSDSGAGMNWADALAYCENATVAGNDDWRLPNVKELQSIVDYSRSPATSNSAAIDPIFNVTAITNEAGEVDYPFYWSSTTHADSAGRGTFGAYVSFGRALGYMNSWVDVHGAGAQRSDPKSGDISQYAQGHGPQGDAVRVNNYVRCVRGGSASFNANGITTETRPTMTVQSSGIGQGQPGGQGNGQGQPPQSGQGQTGGQSNGQGQGQPPQGGQGGMMGQPPQAAIDVCVSQSQGAACSFSSPNGTISGTCQTPPNVSQLACVPSR